MPLLRVSAQFFGALMAFTPFRQTRGALPSSSADPKDLIPSVNRSLRFHRGHAAAWSLRHRLMLDLE